MGGVNGGGGRMRRGGATDKAGVHVLAPKETARPVKPSGKRKVITPGMRQRTSEHHAPRIVPDHVRETLAKQHEEHAKNYHRQARSAARQDQRMPKKGNTAAAEAARQKKVALETASKYHAAQAKRQRQLANAI